MIWNLRRVSVAILLLTAAAASWYLTRALAERYKQPRAAPAIANEEGIDYYIHDFRSAVMDDNGERKYTLTALLLKHYPHEHTVRLTKPHLVKYEAGAAVIDARADSGQLHNVTKELRMSGSVRIVQRGRPPSGRDSETTTTQLRILLN
jgi:LPS export ABC transporter protein LptC